MSSRHVYVVDGTRTPFLKATGKRGAFSAADLAVQAGRSLLMRMPFPASALDEVIIGCVMPAADEANIARLIALRLGCGKAMPAWTVQRNCASGMQALDAARLKIISGESHLIVAGGTEAMSRSPWLLRPDFIDWLANWKQSPWPKKIRTLLSFRPHLLRPEIALLKGLSDPTVGLNMGQTAENLAFHFGITRKAMDSYALHSHTKTAKAMTKHLSDEIVPIIAASGSYISEDSGVRHDSTLDKLGHLRPVFDKRFGHITAGNSAQISDGAAMLILASQEAVQQYQLDVLGSIDDIQWRGLEPEQMGLGPAYVIPPLLQRHGLTMEDIDAWEINEAFAAQVLANQSALQHEGFCTQVLGLDNIVGQLPAEKLNREGGAIAIGHPLAASGARIILHLLYSMQRNKETRGIASLCIGGGQGGGVLLSGGIKT